MEKRKENEAMNFLKSIKFVVLLWVGIFVAWGFSMLNEWLFFHWWVDIVLHFLGGFWVFVLARYILEHYGNEITGNHKNIVTFFAFISFVAFVGVCWEFFEFVLDRYITFKGFTYLPLVFEDTLLDLLTDILGGTTAFVLYFRNGKA